MNLKLNIYLFQRCQAHCKEMVDEGESSSDEDEDFRPKQSRAAKQDKSHKPRMVSTPGTSRKDADNDVGENLSRSPGLTKSNKNARLKKTPQPATATKPTKTTRVAKPRQKPSDGQKQIASQGNLSEPKSRNIASSDTLQSRQENESVATLNLDLSQYSSSSNQESSLELFAAPVLGELSAQKPSPSQYDSRPGQDPWASFQPSKGQYVDSNVAGGSSSTSAQPVKKDLKNKLRKSKKAKPMIE